MATRQGNRRKIWVAVIRAMHREVPFAFPAKVQQSAFADMIRTIDEYFKERSFESHRGRHHRRLPLVFDASALRLATADQKRLIEQAAALQGRSVTDFVLSSLQDAALRAIDEYQRLELSIRDNKAFV